MRGRIQESRIFTEERRFRGLGFEWLGTFRMAAKLSTDSDHGLNGLGFEWLKHHKEMASVLANKATAPSRYSDWKKLLKILRNDLCEAIQSLAEDM